MHDDLEMLTFDACLRELDRPELMSRGLVPAEITTRLHFVSTLGNKASHDALRTEVRPGDAHEVLNAVLKVLEWFAYGFERGPRLPSVYVPQRRWKRALGVMAGSITVAGLVAAGLWLWPRLPWTARKQTSDWIEHPQVRLESALRDRTRKVPLGKVR
jgi:hypothetical protein